MNRIHAALVSADASDTSHSLYVVIPDTSPRHLCLVAKIVTKKMKVLKFGGTSVGSVKSILSLKNIVENEAKHEPVVVVVSALGGITDKLLATSQLALKGDESWKEEFQAMVERHHKMIDTIITNPRQREDLFNMLMRCWNSCAASILVYSSFTT